MDTEPLHDPAQASAADAVAVAMVPAASSASAIPSPAQAKHLVESWQDLKMNFAVLMGAFCADAAWLDRFERMSQRVRKLLAQDADAALYMMLQTATSEINHYSAHHVMHCAVVAQLCSEWFDWPAGERQALFQAALSMNVAMLSLQDSMAKQSGGVSAEQRKRIDEHPRQGADLLRSAGVADELWIDTVLRHHKPVLDGEPGGDAQRTPAQRLAELLHRIDVFTAKLSRRQSRSAASATVAARDACLDTSGHPDAIGATILRVLGLYPPGSYVCLANGELAIVTRRGAKAHTPIVASLRRADNTPCGRPVRRDTSNKEFAVRRAAVAAEFKMVVNHERVLGA